MVAPEVFGDTMLVDGGVIDNCPVVPLVEEKCDVVITVHLRPSAPLADAHTHWQKTQRMLDLEQQRPTKDFIERYMNRLKHGSRAPPVFPIRAVPSHWKKHFAVQPHKDLGGLLSFSAKYLKRRLDEGEQRGGEVVAEILKWAAERSIEDRVKGT
jgi:predicted acylesterase/phospholipase RssA